MNTIIALSIVALVFYFKGIIMDVKAQILAAVAAIGMQLAKASNEIKEKIAALEKAVQDAQDSGADLSEVLAALEPLKTAAQGLDDIVPDQPGSDTPAGGGGPGEEGGASTSVEASGSFVSGTAVINPDSNI